MGSFNRVLRPMSSPLRAAVLVAVSSVCGAAVSLMAQVPAMRFDVSSAKGQLVSPIYEGWYTVGGTTYGLFGYFNRNLEEIVEVPVGPNNRVTPGQPDQGQPTRFFPGQHVGVFAVSLPKDGSKAEVTWTLTANGQTFAIPATLDSQYLIQPQKDEAGTYPGNTPPIIRFDASGATAQGPLGLTTSRSAVVARPLPLEVWVTDDGLPPPPGTKGPAPALRGSPGGRARRQGLNVSWTVYRGPGDVKFGTAAPAVEGGRTETTATFSAPGEYMLRFLAQDSQSGNKCCWTNGYVKVTVQPGTASK